MRPGPTWLARAVWLAALIAYWHLDCWLTSGGAWEDSQVLGVLTAGDLRRGVVVALLLVPAWAALAGRRRASDRSLLCSALESADNAVMITSREGRILWVNRAYCELTGYSAEELVGQSPRLLRSGQQDAKFYEELWSTILAGRVWRGEIVDRRKDGEHVHQLMTITPMTSGPGRIEAFVAVMQDHTDQHQIEQELREARKRADRHAEELSQQKRVLENIIAVIPHRVFWKDRELVFRGCNRAFARDAGLEDPCEIIGRTDFEMPWMQEEAELYRWCDREVMARNEPLLDIEETQLRSDGTQAWVTTSKVPLCDASGEVTGLLGIYIDITDRKKAQSDLRAAITAANAANEAKSRFLATMSHELRTPMTGILGMTDMLKDLPIPDEALDATATIELCARSLLALINDLLDFSKIEAGKIELDSIEFDLESLVQDVVTVVAHAAHEKRLEIDGALLPDVPRDVLGDSLRIRQVLMNLVNNAVKFTAEGGIYVTLSVAGGDEDRPRLRFTIEDTGIGIRAEHRERLFEAFSQADAATTRRFGGTGLGLAISRQLVELMGGEIGFHSREGEGSTFWFELPFEVAPDAERSPRLVGHQVVLIETSDRLREMTHAKLTFEGAATRSASDVEAGLRLVSEAQTEGEDSLYVLLDDRAAADADPVHLGQLSRRARVLLVTASDPSRWGDASTSGFVDVLRRPLRTSQIIAALTRPDALGLDSAPPAAADPLAPLRILLAEDNVINQKVVQRLIEKMGHQIQIVTNGREAVEALGQEKFDLVLMDCQMPEMDGLEATREIRKLPSPSARVPIIALTAHASRGDRDGCLAAGMDDYVSKPINVKALEAALRRACVR